MFKTILKRFIINTIAQDIRNGGPVIDAMTGYHNESLRRSHEEWNGPGSYEILMEEVRVAREQSISKWRQQADLPEI